MESIVVLRMTDRTPRPQTLRKNHMMHVLVVSMNMPRLLGGP